MDADQRIEVARSLAAKVQELQTAPDTLTRLRLAGEVLAIRERLGPAPDGPALLNLTGNEVSASLDPELVYKEAHYWFKTRLQGRSFESAAGPVAISGASWKEIKRGGKQDSLKLRLLPAIGDLITRGKYHGRVKSYKERERFVAFHFFSGVVTLPDLTVEAGIAVGEDAKGSLLYTLNHDMSTQWQKRNAFIGSAGFRAQPDEGAEDGLEPTLDGILDEFDSGINLTILRVISRA